LLLESKSFYEKNLANSQSYSFNTANLTINWDKAEAVKQRFVSNFNSTASLKSNGTSIQNTVQPAKFELDSWGNIELFPSTNDYSKVKIPVSLKLRDGRILRDNRFI